MNAAPSKARRAALYVLGRCRRDGAWSAPVLHSAVEKFGLDRRDAAFCARLCRAVLQKRALCIFYIDRFSLPAERPPGAEAAGHLRWRLPVLFLDRVPSAAPPWRIGALAKPRPGAGVRLVNAVLRRIAGAGALRTSPAGTPATLPCGYSHRYALRKAGGGAGKTIFAQPFSREQYGGGSGATVNTCRNERRSSSAF